MIPVQSGNIFANALDGEVSVPLATNTFIDYIHSSIVVTAAADVFNNQMREKGYKHFFAE